MKKRKVRRASDKKQQRSLMRRAQAWQSLEAQDKRKARRAAL